MEKNELKAHLYILSWNGSLLYEESLDERVVWQMRLESKRSEQIFLKQYLLPGHNIIDKEYLPQIRSFLAHDTNFKKADTIDFTRGIHCILIGWMDCQGNPCTHRVTLSHPTRLTQNELEEFAFSYIYGLSLKARLSTLPTEFIEQWNLKQR